MIRRIEEDGWYQVAQEEATDNISKHPAKLCKVTVPGCADDVHPKTLSSILKTGWPTMTKSYLVVYEVGSNKMSGFAPRITGCISTGRNLQEMRRGMDALEFHLRGLVSDGDAVPEPVATKVDFSFQVTA